LLLSQLRGDQLKTVKVKVQQLLSQEWQYILLALVFHVNF
jgi:hypothetical protein